MFTDKVPRRRQSGQVFTSSLKSMEELIIDTAKEVSEALDNRLA